MVFRINKEFFSNYELNSKVTKLTKEIRSLNEHIFMLQERERYRNYQEQHPAYPINDHYSGYKYSMSDHLGGIGKVPFFLKKTL